MEKQMCRRSAKVALRLFLLLALGSIFGYAQTSPTGSLAGAVVDQSGAVVTAAKVAVKNTATGQEFTTTTADNGTFLVPTLNSGLYAARAAFRISSSTGRSSRASTSRSSSACGLRKGRISNSARSFSTLSTTSISSSADWPPPMSHN